MGISKKLPVWSPSNHGDLRNSPHHPRCCMCPNVTGRYPIPGNGPRPSPILFLGEAPSYKEDRQGIPFAGPTGVEFTYQYLPLTGYLRSEVRVTNVVRCSEAKYRNPKPILAQCCADRWLEAELTHTKPRVLVAMGSIACSLWPSISLSRDHGYAIPLTYKSWSGYVFPIYHPAMGLHSGSSMRLVQSDFHRLGQFLRALESGKESLLSPWVLDKTMPYPSRYTDNSHLDYRLINQPQELYSYFRMYGDLYHPQGSHLSVDSEFIPRSDANTIEDKPYSLSLSIYPTTSLVFRVDQVHPSQNPLIQELRTYIRHQLSLPSHKLICHYSTADLPILDQLSLPWSASHLLDTATIPYHLSHPQSLKILSHRLLRIRQQTFDELTEPLYHAVCYPLAEKLASHTFPHPKGDRSWAPHRYAKSWLPKSLDRYGPPTDPYSLDLDDSEDPQQSNLDERIEGELENQEEDASSWSWDKAWGSMLKEKADKARAMEDYLGHPWPRRTIELVPDEDLLWYAGADADLTLRNAWVMGAMSGDSYMAELCDWTGLEWRSIPGREEWVLPRVGEDQDP